MMAEYLVTFGRAAHLGRFRAISTNDLFCRGDEVVVQGLRGLELGTVLGPTAHALPDPYVGQLLRQADDEDRALAALRHEASQRLCFDAISIAQKLGLSLAVIDAEISLDGRGAILHTIGTGDNAVNLLDQLADRHDLIVRIYDLGSDDPAPADAADALEEFKCDRPDCGERECTDCSDHGGCSSCSAGGAKELQDYFAGLRAKMESERRMPLA